MFEIPSLDAVPRSYTLHTVDLLAARAALTMLDLGMIATGAQEKAPGDLLRSGLKHWLDLHTTDLRRYHFRIDCGEFDARSPFGDPVGRVMRFDFASWNRQPFIVGPAITKCERAITGLGQTALHWLDIAGEILPIYSPHNALRLASFEYWGGCDNEAEVVSQAESDGEDLIKQGLLTRKQFDTHIPHWASVPKNAIRMEALKQLANPRRTTITGRVARALIELIETLARERRKVKFITDEEHPLLPFALWLRWSAKDPMPRIFDDFANAASEHGEFREDAARIAIGYDKGSGQILRNFLRGIEPAFPIARAVEGVLDALLIDRPKTLVEVFK